MFNLVAAIRQDHKRRAGKPELIIPSLVFRPGPITTPREDTVRLLTECARVIASTKLLWRWRRYTGRIVLVEWNERERKFTGFDNNSFGNWLGTHFDLRDQSGMAFGVPSPAVSARIWEELCRNDLPWADHRLENERRRGK